MFLTNTTVQSSNISTSSAIGYAILAVNIDSNKGSYLEYFLPIITECIRISEQEIITLHEIHNLLKTNFGIQVPHHVIQSILKRLKKRNIISYDSKLEVYKPNYEKIDNTNFVEKQTKVLENHNVLIVGLQEFINEKFTLLFSKEEIEVIFKNYLAYSVDTLFRNINEEDEKIRQENYMVSMYLKELEQNHSPLFKHYESIFVGNMVATAMYFTESDKIQQKFKNTQVYFDTTFIIFALGYAGQARQEPCLQLIDLLKKQHASLRCFEHTLEEIKDILHGCIVKLESGITDRFGTTEYFIQQNYNRSDVLTIINALDKDIYNKLKITIVEKPSYDPPNFNIDERELSDYLKNSIRYGNLNSLQKDVDSIHAIIRLRKGNKSCNVETCKAVFITTNTSLSYHTKQIIAGYNDTSNIPPVMDDYALTTIQWIKNPDINPDLPRKRIIADCVAAMQPPERLVKRYLERLNLLKVENKITDEDYYLLRVAGESRELMMEQTQGDEQALTNLDFKELAELTKAKIGEMKDQIIETQQQIIQDKENDIQQKEEEKKKLLLEEENRKIKQQNVSRKISIISHTIISIIISALFVWGQKWALNYAQENNLLNNSVIIVFMYIFPLLSFWGIGVAYIIPKSHRFLTNKVYKGLYQ